MHLYNFNESKLNFEKAINIKHRYYEAYNNLGILFEKFEKYKSH